MATTSPFVKQVSTFSDYGVEAKDIDRQRKMAELLQQQSAAPIEERPGVPISWTQGLAKMLQAYYGKQGIDEATQKEKDLAGRAKMEAQDYFGGIPQPRTTDLNPVAMDDEGNTMPPALQTTQPTRQELMSYALKGLMSGNPLVQPVAGSMLAQYMKQDEPYTLAAGATRYGANGVPIVTAPVTPKAPEPFTLTPGQQRFGPDGKPIAALPEKIDYNKPFLPDGTPNPAYQEYELGKTKAGATRVNTTVNTEKQLFGNIAEGVGKDIATTTSNARAAVGTINTVNRIKEAMDSGKVIAGPTTTARQFLGQLGQVIGVSGKDATEQLTKTREVIQGLAQLELDASQLMKGQGQITEAERGIIKRAASGDIDGMSVPELKVLADAIDKTARFKIRANAANVEKVRGNPNTGELATFMEVAEPPPYGGSKSSSKGTPKSNVRSQADAILNGNR